MNSSITPPQDVPGLFRFVQEFGGSKYNVQMQPELSQRYEELKSNAKIEVLELSEALEMSLSIRRKPLEQIAKFNGHMPLTMSDQDCIAEFGQSLSANKREDLLFIMAQCCKVVLNIQKAIGQDLNMLKKVYQLRAWQAQQEGQEEIPYSLEAGKKAFTKIQRNFNAALEILHDEREPSKSPLYVTVSLENDSTIKTPLPIRAIDVALELANNLQRCPLYQELITELQKRHKQELVTDRAKANKTEVNWSEQFEQAGLRGLPHE